MAKLQRLNAQDMEFIPTCSFDLETTGLAADFSFLLCGSIKPWGQPAKVFRIDDSPDYDKDRSDDKYLVQEIVEELLKYTVVISWNGIKFDVPYLTSRMILHDLEVRPLNTLKHLDLIYAARHRMRLRGNSLAIVQEHVNTADRKTPLVGRIWAQAASGNRKALDEIVRHNIADVDVLEQVARKLGHLIDIRFSLIR